MGSLGPFTPDLLRSLHTNSVIHKAAGLTVPGRSMTLPGTIPENLLSCEWGQWLELSLRVVPAAGRMLDGDFVNRAVSVNINVCMCVCIKFCIVPVVMKTQTPRMGLNPLHLHHHKHNVKVDVDINVDVNANVTCEQDLTLYCVNLIR